MHGSDSRHQLSKPLKIQGFFLFSNAKAIKQAIKGGVRCRSDGIEYWYASDAVVFDDISDTANSVMWGNTMSRNTRAKLSKRNQYYISEYRRKELEYFCLQYEEYKSELQNFPLLPSQKLSERLSETYRLTDPTFDLMVKMERITRSIHLIEQAAYDTDDTLCIYILYAVTHKACTYEYLSLRRNIPCCRNTFYTKLHKFFWLLDKTRD